MPKRGGLTHPQEAALQESATFLQRSFFDVAMLQFFGCCSAASGPNDFPTAEKPMLQCSFFGQDQKGYPQKGYPRIGQISPSLGHFIQQFLREISRNRPHHGYPFCRYPFGLCRFLQRSIPISAAQLPFSLVACCRGGV